MDDKASAQNLAPANSRLQPFKYSITSVMSAFPIIDDLEVTRTKKIISGRYSLFCAMKCGAW
ncbi:MAG: hypothetical protein QMC05_01390, partial [Pseudomonadales bacterium]